MKDSSQTFRWYTGVAHPWFNGVLCNQPATDNAGQTIQDTIDYFQAKSVANFSWWMAPQLDPTSWSSHLRHNGFQFNDVTPGMALELDDLPPPSQNLLTIQRVEVRQKLHVWVDNFVNGFDISDNMAHAFFAVFENFGFSLPIRHSLGMLKNQPVATSSLYIGASVARIYYVATIE